MKKLFLIAAFLVCNGGILFGNIQSIVITNSSKQVLLLRYTPAGENEGVQKQATIHPGRAVTLPYGIIQNPVVFWKRGDFNASFQSLNDSLEAAVKTMGTDDQATRIGITITNSGSAWNIAVSTEAQEFITPSREDLAKAHAEKEKTTAIAREKTKAATIAREKTKLVLFNNSGAPVTVKGLFSSTLSNTLRSGDRITLPFDGEHYTSFVIMNKSNKPLFNGSQLAQSTSDAFARGYLVVTINKGSSASVDAVDKKGFEAILMNGKK